MKQEWWFNEGYPAGKAPLQRLIELIENKTSMTFTRRYASNLLKNGRNNEFRIFRLIEQYSMVDDLCVGKYFLVTIERITSTQKDGVGATPIQAVERCLEKHGVTFR